MQNGAQMFRQGKLSRLNELLMRGFTSDSAGVIWRAEVKGHRLSMVAFNPVSQKAMRFRVKDVTEEMTLGLRDLRIVSNRKSTRFTGTKKVQNKAERPEALEASSGSEKDLSGGIESGGFVRTIFVVYLVAACVAILLIVLIVSTIIVLCSRKAELRTENQENGVGKSEQGQAENLNSREDNSRKKAESDLLESGKFVSHLEDVVIQF